tara:strand:+ start:593 stop:1399 length:807 start_codon:yes stop_codon:yes gene_type:complete
MPLKSHTGARDLFKLPKWGLEFSSTSSQIAALGVDFHCPDLTLWKVEPGHVGIDFIFASPHFEFARSNNVVFDRAASLKAIFDGALYLFDYYHEPFTFTRLIDNLSDETYECWGGNVLVEPFDPLVVSSVVPRFLAPGDKLNPELMLFLARYDEVTRNLLKHLGFNGPDYRTLYSLLDWLKTHGWSEEQIASHSKMSASDVKRFRGTVNNVAVLGPLARHGDNKWEAPSKTMTLPDAQKLILKATYAFLVERAKAVDIIAKWEFIKGD